VESVKAAEKAVGPVRPGAGCSAFDTETRPVFGRPSYIFKVRDRAGRADKVNRRREQGEPRASVAWMRGKSIEESYLPG
jgi:hypothetical protein